MEVVYRQGYLTKQGGGDGFFGRMNWKKRYFVLKGHLLYYYKNQDSFTSGNQPIKAPVDITFYTPSSLANLQFCLLPNDKNGRRYLFESISIPDKEMWLEAFSKSLNPLIQSNSSLSIQKELQSENKISIRKSKQMILKLTKYYLYITPYYQKIVESLLSKDNSIKDCSVEIENLLRMLDICPLQFIGYVISSILLLANEKRYISFLLKNRIIKRINKIFIKIIESDDEEQYTILTIQLLELLIRLCKSKKLVKYLSIEKKDSISAKSISKVYSSEDNNSNNDESSGIDSDVERKKIKITNAAKVEDTSIIISHLLCSSNEIILYNISKFIKSYYLLCLRINKTINSFILYQLLSKKYKVIIEIILEIIMLYSFHEELFINIFRQNKFLLDEILDQMLCNDSIKIYELFIYIFYSLCCYRYQLFNDKYDKISIILAEYNGDSSIEIYKMLFL